MRANQMRDVCSSRGQGRVLAPAPVPAHPMKVEVRVEVRHARRLPDAIRVQALPGPLPDAIRDSPPWASAHQPVSPNVACQAQTLLLPVATETTTWQATWSISSANTESTTLRQRLETLAEDPWGVTDDERYVEPPSCGPCQLAPVTIGATSRQGSHKPEMQDAYMTVQDWAQRLQGHDEDDNGVSFVTSHVPCSLAGVFDGHCGPRSARYASRRLPQLFASNMKLWNALEGIARCQGLSTAAVATACDAMRASFAQLECEILEEDRYKPPGEFDGTTALVGLQAGEHLIIANLGDSRAVLSRDGRAIRLSRDHTPDLPEERSRVEAVGGYVRQHKGIWRLVLPLGPGCGLKICAVSRALGDIDYKEPKPLISAEPDVVHWPLQRHADEFVIYATDGVWAVLSDQEAVECVKAALRQASAVGCDRQQRAAVAALALQMFSIERGSRDDITAVVTLLDWKENDNEPTNTNNHHSLNGNGHRVAQSSSDMDL